MLRKVKFVAEDSVIRIINLAINGLRGFSSKLVVVRKIKIKV